GPVLDPIVSLRRRVRLPPGATARVTFSTLVAPSRAEAVDLAEKYHDAATFDRAATLAWTQAQVQQHHLGMGPDEAHLFQSLARSVIESGRACAVGSPRAVREVSRRGHVRPRRDAGVDAGPGAAASPRHGPRRGAPLPEPRPARALFGPNASTSGGRARTSHG